jgi:hypothetical protein
VKEFMDKGFTFISVGNGALQQNPIGLVIQL